MQVSVVQFSNDVRVELAPQHMPMEQLRAQLGEMVRHFASRFSTAIWHVAVSYNMLAWRSTCTSSQGPSSATGHCCTLRKQLRGSEYQRCLRRRA